MSKGLVARGARSFLPTLLLVAVVATVLGSPPPAAASAGDKGWVVARLAHVDQWFHALAVVGFEGDGPLPFYDPVYAERMAEHKRAAGIFPTRLDLEAPALRERLRADPAFELFHFLPLYFASADRVAMMDALRAVARDGSAASVSARETEFGARVVASVLQTPEQRRLLTDLLDASEAEWDAFLRDHLEGTAEPRAEARIRTQELWNEQASAPLAGYLDRENLAAGVILLSPALGPEGRIFTADPANPADNVIAVGAPPGAGAEVSLSRVVREVCFPSLRRVLSLADASAADARRMAHISSMAAVRCGSYLLERNAPGLVAGYQRSFLGSAAGAGVGAPEIEALFSQSFPITEELHRALWAQVDLDSSR